MPKYIPADVFDFESKREIVRVKRGAVEQSDLPGMEKPKQLHMPEYEEVWTGDYIFENEWQSFRTKKDRKRRYQIMRPVSLTSDASFLIKVFT